MQIYKQPYDIEINAYIYFLIDIVRETFKSTTWRIFWQEILDKACPNSNTFLRRSKKIINDRLVKTVEISRVHEIK